MFLIERLFGLGVYVLALVFICILLTKVKQRTIKKVLFVYSIILSVMAFCYVPYKTSDLYRIYEMMDIVSHKSLKQILSPDRFALDKTYYWLIAQTGIRELLPALTTFICYNCIFYIIYKTSQKYLVTGKNVAIALFFYMSNGTYIFVITGIRSMMGISLLAFCFYRESVEKKFNILHIFIYLWAFFIHQYVAILIFIRFFIPIFDRRLPTIKRCLYSVVLVVISAVALLYFSNYIEQIFEKAKEYITGNLYSYIWDFAIAILVGICNFCMLNKYRAVSKRNKDMNFHSIYLFILISYVIGICFIFEFTIFYRTIVYVIPIMCLPMWLTVLQANDKILQENNSNSVLKQTKQVGLINVNTYLLVFMLILFLNCARGSLCSLKFFVL